MFKGLAVRQGVELIKQGIKIHRLENEIKELDAENMDLCAENKDIRFELKELREYKKNVEEIHEDIIRNLFNLQDVSRLGVSKEYRDTQRNIIINHILKELDDRKSY